MFKVNDILSYKPPHKQKEYIFYIKGTSFEPRFNGALTYLIVPIKGDYNKEISSDPSSKPGFTEASYVSEHAKVIGKMGKLGKYLYGD